MSDRVRIGDMLLEAGLIKQAQLDAALAAQQKSGRRIGAELVAQGMLDEVQLTQVISNQLSIPWVSLFHVEFSRELLNLITPEFAEEHSLIPIYVRRLKGGHRVLFVAMVDPTNDELLEQLTESLQLPVKPMIAPPSEITNAIGAYYFGRRPSTTAPADSEKPKLGHASPDDAVAVPRAAATPKVEKKTDGTKKRAAPAKAPPPKGTGAAKMITLTLLDGTSVRLPAPGSENPSQEETLTTSDLIAALRARSQGKDVSAVLPDTTWEELFAALLTLLIRKGLVADWEFAQEWLQGEAIEDIED